MSCCGPTSTAGAGSSASPAADARIIASVLLPLRSLIELALEKDGRRGDLLLPSGVPGWRMPSGVALRCSSDTRFGRELELPKTSGGAVGVRGGVPGASEAVKDSPGSRPSPSDFERTRRGAERSDEADSERPDDGRLRVPSIIVCERARGSS